MAHARFRGKSAQFPDRSEEASIGAKFMIVVAALSWALAAAAAVGWHPRESAGELGRG